MRYGIAFAVFLVAFGAGFVFVRQTDLAIESQFRQILSAAKAAGTLPAEIDPERAQVADFGIELKPTLMLRLRISRFLVACRYVLIVRLALTCLGLARAGGHGRAKDW